MATRKTRKTKSLKSSRVSESVRIRESIEAGERAVAEKKQRASRARTEATRIRESIAEGNRAVAEKRKLRREIPRVRLVDALEAMQALATEAGFASRLTMIDPISVQEAQWNAPWFIVGEFAWVGPVTYDDLRVVFGRWRLSKIEKQIHPHRLSRIRASYTTERGEESDYTLAGRLPWNLAIQAAYDQCDPNDPSANEGRGSLAHRYGVGGIKTDEPTLIREVHVWFSTAIGKWAR